jgi:hypothetical protein
MRLVRSSYHEDTEGKEQDTSYDGDTDECQDSIRDEETGPDRDGRDTTSSENRRPRTAEEVAAVKFEDKGASDGLGDSVKGEDEEIRSVFSFVFLPKKEYRPAAPSSELSDAGSISHDGVNNDGLSRGIAQINEPDTDFDHLADGSFDSPGKAREEEEDDDFSDDNHSDSSDNNLYPSPTTSDSNDETVKYNLRRYGDAHKRSRQSRTLLSNKEIAYIKDERVKRLTWPQLTNGFNTKFDQNFKHWQLRRNFSKQAPIEASARTLTANQIQYLTNKRIQGLPWNQTAAFFNHSYKTSFRVKALKKRYDKQIVSIQLPVTVEDTGSMVEDIGSSGAGPQPRPLETFKAELSPEQMGFIDQLRQKKQSWLKIHTKFTKSFDTRFSSRKPKHLSSCYIEQKAQESCNVGEDPNDATRKIAYQSDRYTTEEDDFLFEQRRLHKPWSEILCLYKSQFPDKAGISNYKPLQSRFRRIGGYDLPETAGRHRVKEYSKQEQKFILEEGLKARKWPEISIDFERRFGYKKSVGQLQKISAKLFTSAVRTSDPRAKLRRRPRRKKVTKIRLGSRQDTRKVKSISHLDKAPNQNPIAKKQVKRRKWEGYPPPNTPLPCEIAPERICAEFPNHLTGEVLLGICKSLDLDVYSDGALVHSSKCLLKLMPNDTRDKKKDQEYLWIRDRIRGTKEFQSKSFAVSTNPNVSNVGPDKGVFSLNSTRYSRSS